MNRTKQIQAQPHNQLDQTPASEHHTMPTAEVIQTWLISQIAERLLLDLHEIDIYESFDSYGLASLHVAAIASEIEDWLGREISLDLFDEYNTIERLARHLAP